MTERTTVATSIVDVEHAGTSSNGNPTYRLHTEHGVYLTETDSQVGYVATNYSPRSGAPAVPVTLTFERGRVVRIEARYDA